MKLLAGEGRRGARRGKRRAPSSHARLPGRGASTLLACGRAALNGRRATVSHGSEVCERLSG